MRFKLILTAVFIFILISLMFLYFMPLNNFNLTATPQNYNFSIGGNLDMQYYPNMRYSNYSIPYKISNCSLEKQNEMQNAFEIIENKTNLVFFSTDDNEQISVTCEDKNRIENEMFVAGEGGPTNIIVSGNFYVITKGEILLIRNSDCPNPNIAIHELLHSLGFKHSANPNNIMYNVTNCNQVIGDDTLTLINQLYSIPSYPDLAFENVSGSMNGRFLDVNMTITNFGLDDAPESNLVIYADGNIVKQITLDPIKIGGGMSISMSNIFVSQINFNEINLEINSTFNEITKENNKINLKIKK